MILCIFLSSMGPDEGTHQGPCWSALWWGIRLLWGTGDHGADKSTVFSSEVGEITVLMTATRYWMLPRSHALTVLEFPFITSSNPHKAPTRYVLWYPYFTNAKLKIKEVSCPKWYQDLNLSRLPPEYWIALNVPVPQKASLLFSTLLGSHEAQVLPPATHPPLLPGPKEGAKNLVTEQRKLGNANVLSQLIYDSEKLCRGNWNFLEQGRPSVLTMFCH